MIQDQRDILEDIIQQYGIDSGKVMTMISTISLPWNRTLLLQEAFRLQGSFLGL